MRMLGRQHDGEIQPHETDYQRHHRQHTGHGEAPAQDPLLPLVALLAGHGAPAQTMFADPGDSPAASAPGEAARSVYTVKSGPAPETGGEGKLKLAGPIAKTVLDYLFATEGQQ